MRYPGLLINNSSIPQSQISNLKSELVPDLSQKSYTALSVHDAVNAFDRTHRSYAVNSPAPEGASEQAAAAAAHRVLVALLPNQTQLLDRQRIFYNTKSGSKTPLLLERGRGEKMRGGEGKNLAREFKKEVSKPDLV